MAVRAWPVSAHLIRLDRRTVVAALLAALAAALVLILTRPPDRIPVLVAGTDLPAGTPLATLDLDVRYVESGEGLVEGTTAGDLGAWVLRFPITEGEPLLVAALAPPEQLVAPNLIALSLSHEHAVLGELGPGDHVDVYITEGSEFAAASTATRRVAAGVYVVRASMSDDPSRRHQVDVLLAVDDELAAVLAGSTRQGTVDLVKVSR